MSIKLESVSKTYGEQVAVQAISFEAKAGEIVGFLGPNGAGKSTTMKMLTGYVEPSAGVLYVSGINVAENPIAVQQEIGYLPEHNPLYVDMYVKEYLAFRAGIHKVNKERITQVIAQVGLQEAAHKRIKELSKGYRQRVGLAAAILHNPAVLILDEPTTGLDPNQLVEVRELIRNLGKDKTVLLSTHIMQEVEAVCDRVVILNRGEIVVDKDLKALKTDTEQVIRVTFDYKLEEQFVKRLPNLVSFKNTLENNWILVFDSEEDMRPAIFDFAQENGLKILGLNAENKNLETIFKEVTKQ
ncbi:Gliding motility-associated ABC transporter ATP-binding subunit GldA [Tenacibaculum litopenaei]|uniref:gliding motility-associated ABC transporter ATP-binding subunit GldA n=1 Tax=Tenacibaculum litopenaei TaxID=396016 RepID=UPI003893C964